MCQFSNIPVNELRYIMNSSQIVSVFNYCMLFFHTNILNFLTLEINTFHRTVPDDVDVALHIEI